MADNTMLVVGGTGKVGRRVVRRLLTDGVPVKSASRTSAVRFDWHDDTTWEPAVTGCTAAYLVDSQDGDPIPKLRRFTRLAADLGVRRLVLLSSREPESGEPDLAEKEQTIKDVGAEWTVLRPTWFAQNFSETPPIHQPLRAGELVLPAGEGTEPFIDVEDIAAVAVEALTKAGHNRQTYDLSGPTLLSFRQAVDVIATATGRYLTYRTVTGAEYAANPDRYGNSPAGAETFAHLMRNIADDTTGFVSDGVQRALGREPTSFDDYVARTILSGAWDA